MGAMSFMLENDETNIIHDKVDYIIGCDGAFSKVKKIMSKFVRFDCSQQYLDHGYIELLIPPKSNGDQALEDGFVHSWPRGTFMLIAFPNLDNSFNVILFMSLTAFESIRSDEEVIQFFEHYFPDAIDLIGKKELIKTFFTTKPSPLISTKCKPYNYCDKALRMGDSAHAMSPFLAQGMNCGFEDCLILDQLLDKHNSLSKVFPLFSDSRVDDCHTIVDLSMDNYIEIRDSINSLGFMIRKYFDLTLNHLFPNYWIPVYSMVAFHTIPYHKCRKYKEWQESMIYSIKTLILLALTLGLVYSCWEYLT